MEMIEAWLFGNRTHYSSFESADIAPGELRRNMLIHSVQKEILKHPQEFVLEGDFEFFDD